MINDTDVFITSDGTLNVMMAAGHMPCVSPIVVLSIVPRWNVHVMHSAGEAGKGCEEDGAGMTTHWLWPCFIAIGSL
jgi:hypothetical protein